MTNIKLLKLPGIINKQKQFILLNFHKMVFLLPPQARLDFLCMCFIKRGLGIG